DKYCLLGEIKKLEIELWNLKVRGNDVPAYTECFQELTLICTKFVANETEKIDKYIGGRPENIYRSVKASKPKTFDETIELANELMDQKLRTYAERQTNNKRKADDSFRNNHGHQQQLAKRQNVAKIYNMGSGERKPYRGNLPKCTKCHLHHNGSCTQKCHKCNKIKYLGPDAYSMTWEVLKKKITDKYCLLGEIKKLEIELWNLKVRGNDVPAYTECFQELTLICTKFVANETEKIDKYIGGRPENIYRSVKASKPKTFDETIELANELMDQKLRTYAERQTNNKRKADDSFRNNHGHQQQLAKSNKRRTHEGFSNLYVVPDL
nr:reverse transcriptase domain-containing protein [Tanacetum cinerariifolium]